MCNSIKLTRLVIVTTNKTDVGRQTLDRLRSIFPDMIKYFASQSQTCQLLDFFFFNIEMKLWKVVQS